jgi:DUF1365 family protein
MTAVLATQRPAPVKAATAAIYRGTVRHRRSTPIMNQFTRRLFLAYLDVDALPGSLDRLPLWSGRRAAPIRFRRRDFLDGGTNPLGDEVRDIVEGRLGRRPTGPVHLLAHLRTFGWLFNPIAVYYCWQPSGDALDAIVVEVTNTPWGERHHYVLDANRPEMSADQPKALHVSPFLPMDMEYRITWTPPRENLLLRIEVARSGTVEFEADLSLQRCELNHRRAATILVQYPMMTMRVSVSIYRQAFRLLRKGVPLYRHLPRRERGGRP